MADLDLSALEALHEAAIRYPMTMEEKAEAIRMLRLATFSVFPELLRLARIGLRREATMPDLTPETALAMATTARGVVADAEQVKRLWSNASGGLREMEEAWARDTLAVLDALGFEVRRKSSCTVYSTLCPEHGFIHGAEAEELREGIEKLIGDAESVDSECLQALVDRVDARDSLARLEAKDGGDHG